MHAIGVFDCEHYDMGKDSTSLSSKQLHQDEGYNLMVVNLLCMALHQPAGIIGVREQHDRVSPKRYPRPSDDTAACVQPEAEAASQETDLQRMARESDKAQRQRLWRSASENTAACVQHDEADDATSLDRSMHHRLEAGRACPAKGGLSVYHQPHYRGGRDFGGTDWGHPLLQGRLVRMLCDYDALHGTRVGEAKVPGPPPPLTLMTSAGDEIKLRLAHVGTRGHFRIQGGTTHNRKRGGDKRTIPAAFQSWLQKFGDCLDEQSREDLAARISRGDLPGMNTNPEEIPVTQDAVDDMRRIESQGENPEMPEPVRWTLPALEMCQRLLGSEVHELIGNRAQTQRHIPKSVITSIATLIQWLLEQSVDEELPPEQRQVAVLGVLLAPRLLWQSPTKTDGRLAPHARPREVKRRMLLFTEGQWEQLLPPNFYGGTERQAAIHDQDDPDKELRAAGHSIRKSLLAGRPSQGWKRIESLGLLPPGQDTCRKLAAK